MLPEIYRARNLGYSCRDAGRRCYSAASSPEALARELTDLYLEKGNGQYDPMVTQMEHALQTAALAEAEGADDALVTAAFLHDVGHVLLDEHEGNADFQAGKRQ